MKEQKNVTRSVWHGNTGIMITYCNFHHNLLKMIENNDEAMQHHVLSNCTKHIVEKKNVWLCIDCSYSFIFSLSLCRLMVLLIFMRKSSHRYYINMWFDSLVHTQMQCTKSADGAQSDKKGSKKTIVTTCTHTRKHFDAREKKVLSRLLVADEFNRYSTLSKTIIWNRIWQAETRLIREIYSRDDHVLKKRCASNVDILSGINHTRAIQYTPEPIVSFSLSLSFWCDAAL